MGTIVWVGIVFLLDLLTPLGVEVWVLYLPVIFAPALLNSSRQILVLTWACSGLVVAGSFFSHPGSLIISVVWSDVVNRGMGLLAIWLIAFAGLISARSWQLAQAVNALHRKTADLEAIKLLQRQVVETVAREQRRIGQELHDGIGQQLTGAGLMVNALAQRLSESSTEGRIARRLLTELDRAHQEVRILSRGLLPVQVESLGLQAALEDLAVHAREQSGVEVTFECPMSVRVADPRTATELFRIAQEAVSNALRHARPRQVQLRLLSEAEGLCLSIQDDGCGLQKCPEQCRGMGLRIMQYRAEQIGAILQIGPAPGNGTMVSCVLSRGCFDDPDKTGCST
jgi:signal transduction histidine kinase